MPTISRSLLQPFPADRNCDTGPTRCFRKLLLPEWAIPLVGWTVHSGPAKLRSFPMACGCCRLARAACLSGVGEAATRSSWRPSVDRSHSHKSHGDSSPTDGPGGRERRRPCIPWRSVRCLRFSATRPCRNCRRHTTRSSSKRADDASSIPSHGFGTSRIRWFGPATYLVCVGSFIGSSAESVGGY